MLIRPLGSDLKTQAEDKLNRVEKDVKHIQNWIENQPYRTGIDLQTKAEEELNEVPNRIGEDVQLVQNWIENQPHLYARTDDQWIIGFLRSCKFSLQRTKEKLDYFYTIRLLLPEVFNNRDPLLPEIQEILKSGAITPLPVTDTPGGPRIMLIRYSVCDPNKMPFVNILKTYFMIIDVLMNEDDNTMISGTKMIIDYKEFPLSYILQLTPNVVKRMMQCFLSAYPVRLRGIYYINAPGAIETVTKVVKTFMSQKLRDRMHVWSDSNSDELYKYFPKKLMPKDYGGDNGTIDEISATWKKKVESYKDWFMDDAKYCTDETLRPEESKPTTDIFGVEGTFRKLAID